MQIEWIRRLVKLGNYELSAHAEDERQDEEISLDDIEYVLQTGEIIEQYPEDPRGHSCLVLGYGKYGTPIHIVAGKSSTQQLRVITVYIPMPPKWVDPKTRRSL